MLKKLSKYFSLFLVLILVNSNYSFALIHMMCKMNNSGDACKCKENSNSRESEFDSMDKGCCVTEIKEINNTNTLESNRISLIKDTSFLTVDFFEKSILYSNTFSNTNILLNHFHPPSDIPILFSHILI